MCKKFLLSAVLAAAVCLSACGKNTEIIDDFTETFPQTEAAQTVTTAETGTGFEIVPDPYPEEKTTSAEENAGARQYFKERGFKDFYVLYRGSENYGITADMNDFDGDPFEEVDKEHLKTIERLTLKNVDGRSLDFLSRFVHYTEIIVTDYSGSADFSSLNDNVYFDNYMGGDLSTIAPKQNYRSICFKNYDGRYLPNGLENCGSGVSYVYFEDYDEDVDFSFLTGYTNIRNLGFDGQSINTDTLADLLENSSVTIMNITVREYSTEDSDKLMKAARAKTVNYSLDSSPWDYTKTPTEGVAVFANLLVNKNAVKKQWDCQVSGAQAYPETWNYHGSLVCTFTNFTEEAQTVNSVQIFRDEKGKTEAMSFADGSTSHNLDFDIDPDTNSDLDITEDIFHFSECETGIYKVVFDVNGERLEQQFFIFNGDENFLTEEQQEAFDKAYEITERYFGCSTYLPQEYADEHTAEEFLENMYEGYTREYAYSKSLGNYIDSDGKLIAISGDRGGDISVQENFFVPIYADENEVLFKTFVVHGHEDYPYYIWFEEMNFHMVKTDEGWRFDKFDIWF